MTTALFIGRFQPFHLGHLDAVKQILKENDRVIIGIGSAENNFLPDNPFTGGERFQMIQEALQSEKIQPENYDIIPVRNIDNYGLWCRHVEILSPPFQKVYTESPIVKKLFREYGKYEIHDIRINHQITATEVREAMLRGKEWEKMVPKAVALIIKKLNGVERLKNL